MFTLTIETDNDAFGANDSDEEQRCQTQAVEVARILRKAAIMVEAGLNTGAMIDLNGLKCGKFQFS